MLYSTILFFLQGIGLVSGLYTLFLKKRLARLAIQQGAAYIFRHSLGIVKPQNSVFTMEVGDGSFNSLETTRLYLSLVENLKVKK